MESQVEDPSKPLQQSSKLLCLPAEIRDMIWKLAVLAQNEKIHGEPGTLDAGTFNPTTSTRLLSPLRAVCRATNLEVSPHTFSLTVFAISQLKLYFPRFFIWLERIGTHNRLAIQQIRLVFEYWHGDVDLPSEEANKWCRVLQVLPNLRHLSFPKLTEHAVDYWHSVIDESWFPDTFPQSEDESLFCRRTLRTALKSCPKLSSWTCNYSLLPMVTFATATPNLQAIQIDLRGHNEGMLPSTFQPCPSMRLLQLGSFSDLIWRNFSNGDFKTHTLPKALQSKYLIDLSRSGISTTVEHPSGVRVAIVPDMGWQHSDIMKLRIDYRPLLRVCPNLVYLGLECGFRCDQLESFPRRLETVALIFDTEIDMEELAQCLEALRVRCSNLSEVRIFIKWVIQTASDELLRISEPLLQQLKSLKDQGIHVAYFARTQVPAPVGYEDGSSSDDDLVAPWGWGEPGGWGEPDGWGEPSRWGEPSGWGEPDEWGPPGGWDGGNNSNDEDEEDDNLPGGHEADHDSRGGLLNGRENASGEGEHTVSENQGGCLLDQIGGLSDEDDDVGSSPSGEQSLLNEDEGDSPIEGEDEGYEGEDYVDEGDDYADECEDFYMEDD